MNQNPILIYIPVSLGELIDKITILEIKNELIADLEKKAHVRSELVMLREQLPQNFEDQPKLDLLHLKLKEVNLSIWKSEDALRIIGKITPLDEKAYLEQTKNSHDMNEERFKIKREINSLGGSLIQEQKSYI